MNRIALTAALLFCTASFVYVGCKKDDVADSETTSSTDNSLCEGEFMRVLPTVNKIAIDEAGVHRWGPGGPTVQSCPTISVDTASSFPVVLTIDYGSAGCTDSVDGKVRKGRMIINVDRPWDSVGCVMTVTLDSFYVGAIHFEGTTTITRTATDQFTMVLNNGHCSKGGATPWDIDWNTNKTITWTSGINNSQQRQEIRIFGTTEGTDRNGQHFTSTIDAANPIVRDMSCTWITQGTVELTPDGKATRTIDFGNGSCDNRGTIMIEGNTFEFTMQ